MALEDGQGFGWEEQSTRKKFSKSGATTPSELENCLEAHNRTGFEVLSQIAQRHGRASELRVNAPTCCYIRRTFGQRLASLL